MDVSGTSVNVNHKLDVTEVSNVHTIMYVGPTMLNSLFGRILCRLLRTHFHRTSKQLKQKQIRVPTAT